MRLNFSLSFISLSLFYLSLLYLSLFYLSLFLLSLSLFYTSLSIYINTSVHAYHILSFLLNVTLWHSLYLLSLCTFTHYSFPHAQPTNFLPLSQTLFYHFQAVFLSLSLPFSLSSCFTFKLSFLRSSSSLSILFCYMFSIGFYESFLFSNWSENFSQTPIKTFFRRFIHYYIVGT